MNIIKENLFFVVMGAVVLLALVLFVALVQPAKSRNNEADAKVKGLEKSLADLKNVPNMAAITVAREYNSKYQAELDSMILEMSKMKLSADLPNLGANEKNAPGAYKVVYEQDILGLKKQLAEKRITTVPDSWHFWNWGELVPSDEGQRILAAKEFSLISQLVSIAASPELHVMQLDRVEVNPGETRSGDYRPLVTSFGAVASGVPRVEPYFDVFPFILEVRMPVERYEILLRELLRSNKEIPIPIYVRQVSMGRIEDDPRVTRQIPPLYVSIRVEGWALDYHLIEASKTGATRGLGGLQRVGG